MADQPKDRLVSIDFGSISGDFGPAKPISPDELIRMASEAGVPITDMATAVKGELPGTKTLDYIALALILAPPAVVADMFIRGQPIQWGKTSVASLGAWVLGALTLVAAHKWQRWRSTNGRIAAVFIRLENRFWGRALIAFLFLGTVLGARAIFSDGLAPAVVHDAPTAKDIAAETAPIQGQVDALRARLSDAQQQRDRALAEAARWKQQTAQSRPILPPAPANLTDSRRLIAWGQDIGMCQTSIGGALSICGLVLSGTSTATTNIKFDKAQLTGINGDVADLKIDAGSDGKIPVTQAKIPPGSPFTLYFDINPALDVPTFLAKWGHVHFNAEYQNTKFNQFFDDDDIRRMLGPRALAPHPIKDH